MKDSVAKAMITVASGYDNYYLLSRKRNPGNRNDGKLEFLGGRLDEGESASQALLRELTEEEPTGHLARYAANAAEFFFVTETSGVLHHIFTFTIALDDFTRLRHCPVESYGHELIAPIELGRDRGRYSCKTNGILGCNHHESLAAHTPHTQPIKTSTLRVAT